MFFLILASLKLHSVPPFLLPHSRFCIIWFYCIMFYSERRYFIKCCRDLLFYAVYGFLKCKMIQGKWIHSNLLLFLFPKIWCSLLHKLSSVPWISSLSNQRLASQSVCEIRKITEFPALLLAKSCLPPVDTLKQMSNELNVG